MTCPYLFLRRALLSLVLPALLFAADLPGWAQTPAAASKTPAAAKPDAAQLPPFDRLELFAFFAAGPIPAYAKQVIQQRGCTFAPDATFIAAFPYPQVQEILRSIKPRASQPSTAEREAAFALLPHALEATHHRQFGASEEDYQKALKLAPDSAMLHLAHASNFLLVPDGAKAEPEARRALELWPDNADAHGVLSMAYMVEKKFPEAVAEARETLRLFPEHASAKFQLGVSLAQNHQYEEAIPALRNALAVLPRMPALHKFLGISLLQTKQTDAALRELDTYVATDPSDPEGHYFLGLALRAAGHPDEAKSQFQQAGGMKPPRGS
jgi:tetratricopeptide (TPR) repeat protein